MQLSLPMLFSPSSFGTNVMVVIGIVFFLFIFCFCQNCLRHLQIEETDDLHTESPPVSTTLSEERLVHSSSVGMANPLPGSDNAAFDEQMTEDGDEEPTHESTDIPMTRFATTQV